MDEQEIERAMAVHSVDDETRLRTGGDETDVAMGAEGELVHGVGGAGATAKEQVRYRQHIAHSDAEDDLPYDAPVAGDANR